jgi:dolichyl-diphosphooligosaccharide--protein glycosyltransferase
MGASAAREQVEALRTRDMALATPRPQLLVVCWEDIPLLYWISFYGNWDLASGTSRHATVLALSGGAALDRETGELVRAGGSSRVPLASAEILSHNSVARVPLPERPGAGHLLVNRESGKALLLDDAAYASMAVQLLLGDPARPEQARYFKLVHEGFPQVRIYEVLPGDCPAAQAKAAKQ